MSYDPKLRLAEPGEDDVCLERIEVEFAMPVFVTQSQQARLAELIQEICKAPANTPVNGVHWQSGVGSKPKWSQADALFLGKPAAAGTPEIGEPNYDDSVLFFESSAREAYPDELKRHKRTK